jgi:hypothetical protein
MLRSVAVNAFAFFQGWRPWEETQGGVGDPLGRALIRSPRPGGISKLKNFSMPRSMSGNVHVRQGSHEVWLFSGWIAWSRQSRTVFARLRCV